MKIQKSGYEVNLQTPDPEPIFTAPAIAHPAFSEANKVLAEIAEIASGFGPEFGEPVF